MSNKLKSLHIKINSSSLRYASNVIDAFFSDEFYEDKHDEFKNKIETLDWWKNNNKDEIISLPDELTEMVCEMANIISESVNSDKKGSDYNIYDVFMSRRDLSKNHENINKRIENSIKSYEIHKNISFYLKEQATIINDIELLVLSLNGENLLKLTDFEWHDNEILYSDFINNSKYSKYHKKAKIKSEKFNHLVIENCDILRSLNYSEYFRLVTIEQWSCYADLIRYIVNKKDKVDNKS